MTLHAPDISTLPLDALRALAALYQAHLDQVRAAIATAESRATENMARRRRRSGIAQIRAWYVDQLTRGRDRHTIAREAAHLFGHTADQAHDIMDWTARQARSKSKRIRNRNIRRQAAAGATNADLARQYRLHPSTIQRIVNEKLACPED